MVRNYIFEYYIIRYKMSMDTAFSAKYNTITGFSISNPDGVSEENDTSKYYRYLHSISNTPTGCDLINLTAKYGVSSVSCIVTCYHKDHTTEEYELILYAGTNFNRSRVLYSIKQKGDKDFYLTIPYGSVYFIDLLKNSIKMRRRRTLVAGHT
jgi:hypothetical protein